LPNEPDTFGTTDEVVEDGPDQMGEDDDKQPDDL